MYVNLRLRRNNMHITLSLNDMLGKNATKSPDDRV